MSSHNTEMSDVDDDFMCEDEEDYGLVSGTVDFEPQHRFFIVSAFFLIVFVCALFRNTQKTATLSQMSILKINTTTAKR